MRYRSGPLRPARAVLAALALVFGAPGYGQDAWYQGPIPPDPALTAIEVSPLWRDRLDRPTAVVTDVAVIYLRDGRLVATELDGGWQLWSYGAGLSGQVLLTGGQVVVTEGAKVTALDAATGQTRWSRQLNVGPVQYVRAAESVLLVGGAGGAVTLDSSTGEVARTLELEGSASAAYLDSDLVLMRAAYGEPHTNYLLAFDGRTGRETWRRPYDGAVLAVEDGLVYVIADQAQGQTAADFTIAALSARTGAVTEQWDYSFGGLIASWSAALATPTVLTETDLLVTAGAQLFRFPRGGALRPAASYRAAAGAALRAGPHLGLLFFEGADHGLQAVALDDGRVIDYVAPGAQLSRLDLYGERAYVGRTDGTFKALDLGTGRVRLILRTGSTGFGPTLTAGGFVIVQSATELLVLEAVR